VLDEDPLHLVERALSTGGGDGCGVGRSAAHVAVAATIGKTTLAPIHSRDRPDAAKPRAFAVSDADGVDSLSAIHSSSPWTSRALCHRFSGSFARQFAIVPPAAQRIALAGFDHDVAITPDGRQIVYRTVNANGDSVGALLTVRSFDQLDARLLGGISSVRYPFISPDGNWIGFFTSGLEMKRVSILGRHHRLHDRRPD
jgi:hypothetical protein